jgi:hypothetical protein
MGKAASFVSAFLAIHVDAAVISETRTRIVKCRERRQVGRTKTRERSRKRDVIVAGAIPHECILHQVFAVKYPQRSLLNPPFGNERPREAVLANDAIGCRQFVVRQQRERTVAVVECAEPIGNTDHAVRRNAVRFQID